GIEPPTRGFSVSSATSDQPAPTGLKRVHLASYSRLVGASIGARFHAAAERLRQYRAGRRVGRCEGTWAAARPELAEWGCGSADLETKWYPPSFAPNLHPASCQPSSVSAAEFAQEFG